MQSDQKLPEPIKVNFTGKLRQVLTERAIDYTHGSNSSEEWEDIRRTLERQKTNIVIESESEAENFISIISGYEKGRTWMDSNMHNCATRVKNEIQAGLDGDETVNIRQTQVFRCEKHNSVYTERGACLQCMK